MNPHCHVEIKIANLNVNEVEVSGNKIYIQGIIRLAVERPAQASKHETMLDLKNK
jgi:hypothetical protein